MGYLVGTQPVQELGRITSLDITDLDLKITHYSSVDKLISEQTISRQHQTTMPLFWKDLVVESRV